MQHFCTNLQSGNENTVLIGSCKQVGCHANESQCCIQQRLMTKRKYNQWQLRCSLHPFLAGYWSRNCEPNVSILAHWLTTWPFNKYLQWQEKQQWELTHYFTGGKRFHQAGAFKLASPIARTCSRQQLWETASKGSYPSSFHLLTPEGSSLRYFWLSIYITFRP